MSSFAADVTTVALDGGVFKQSSAEAVAANAKFGAVRTTGAADAARNKALFDGTTSVDLLEAVPVLRVLSFFIVSPQALIVSMKQAHARRHLYDVVRAPEVLATFSLETWQAVIDEARVTGHAGRLEQIATDASIVHSRLERHLSGARVGTLHRIALTRWEVTQLTALARHATMRIMLLKGAAYLAADLPFAVTRLSSDVDVLVAPDDLQRFVAVCNHYGWNPTPLDPYDQHYFFEWMHELPPYRHTTRGTYLDIHHALLPKTSRLQPDTEKVWEGAVQLPNSPLLVPCPEDMVLHCAFHAYHQGEFDNAPRDVVDMFDLLSHFSKKDPGFWARLVERAVEIGVVTPLWHAISVTRFIFDIGPPPDVQARLDSLFPRTHLRDFTQRLIRQVTSDPVQSDAKAALAQKLLHARSHYLRMPLAILARHLVTKSYYNWQRSREAAKAQKAHLQQFKQ